MLTNQDLNEDMDRLLEDAELDEAQEARLAREFSREYHLITRDDRLEKVAEDIVRHFVSRGHLGKGTVVFDIFPRPDPRLGEKRIPGKI